MKYSDISSLSTTELMRKAMDLRMQIFEATMKNSLGQLANPMTIRHMRRDIARMKTVVTANLAGELPKSMDKGKTAPAIKAKTIKKTSPASKKSRTKSAKGE